MGYIQGESRQQQSLFLLTLDDFVPSDHVCRVIEAFVEKLEMSGLGFQRAEPAATGRPGYDPRDLVKLYLYGYLHQVRSSRRLEAECRRNVEMMWLLGRLSPDYKSIAEFRRMHGEAVSREARTWCVWHGRSVWCGDSGSPSTDRSSAPSAVPPRCGSAKPSSAIWSSWKKPTQKMKWSSIQAR